MPRQLIANTAVLATGHPLGAAAGLEILQQGGNAIDAAVAAMLALCVVIPGSVGLGGYGGCAVIRVAPRKKHAAQNGSKIIAVDFDSRAPLGFREGLVTADPQSNYYGARSVSVPAVVAGLDLILRKFGTKPWRDVSQPAIRLAEEGFKFDHEHQRHFGRCAPHFDSKSLAALFPEGVAPKVGDCWRQPDLAGLLHRLSNEGPAAFYNGDIAQQMVRFLRERGGILADEDFCSYRPQIVEPLSANLRGVDIYTAPPPSGGITSLAIVQTMEQLIDSTKIEPWSGQYFHWLTEAMKDCWSQRQHWLGDPDHVRIPFEQLLGKPAAQSRVQRNLGGRNVAAPTAPTQLSMGKRPSDAHTANVIASDGDGNLVSLTATQGWMYGSHLVVGGLGLVLNHGMSRFDYSFGHPNAPAAGKRMQHNMAPVIALRGNEPAFAYGMPGGPKIVNVTAQLALDTIAFGATPAESIAAPRIHTEGYEPLVISTNMPKSIVAELEKLGHTVRREEDMGGPVNVLAINPQTRQIDIASGESTGAVAGL